MLIYFQQRIVFMMITGIFCMQFPIKYDKMLIISAKRL